ncbi:MAG TPA: helix-turn-helix domain-containing protein [Chthonomonadales bacterium]|nr:helix-turn-helix domain-containing protein [Chthonomonadales bacterium]
MPIEPVPKTSRPKQVDASPSVSKMVEDIVGCKWSLEILALVRRGVNRPGSIVRAVEGLTTKVMNERLAKMVRYGIIERIAYPEIPPRVEYHLTAFGNRFIKILDAIEELERSLHVPS